MSLRFRLLVCVVFVLPASIICLYPATTLGQQQGQQTQQGQQQLTPHQQQVQRERQLQEQQLLQNQQTRDQQFLEQQRQQQQQAAIAEPQMPEGFPLAAEQQQYINQLLEYWEGTADQVRRYECDITRWNYDKDICNYRKPENQHLVAAMISRGKIRYSNPDKGMYEIDQKWQFDGPPEQPGGEPKYVRLSEKNPQYDETEKWICDGASIFEFDFQNKRLYELALPAENQGEGLKNSPLPFVFGAKAADLLDRYWIRDVTPQGVEGQYWLEAWPKRISDAQNYSKIEIILSADPFLPMSVHMYAANYDIKTNPAKQVFNFEQRQINGGLMGFKDFLNVFVNPKTPLGWQRVQKKLVQNERDYIPGNEQPRVGQLPGQGQGN